MDEKEFEKLIRRCRSGQATNEELASVEKWLDHRRQKDLFSELSVDEKEKTRIRIFKGLSSKRMEYGNKQHFKYPYAMAKHLNGRHQIFTVLILIVIVSCKQQPKEEVSERPDFYSMLKPVPKSATFSQEGYFVWGGSPIAGEDGKYHLYYSRWPKELGFNAWVTHSEVAHAVADGPLGPYTFQDIALPPRGDAFWDGLCTHNPTVNFFDGKYHIYYMGNTGDWVNMEELNFVHRNNQRIGVAVSESPNGPWERFDSPLIDVSPDSLAHDALMTSNPSVTLGREGEYLIVYKAVGKKRELPFGGPVVHMVGKSDSPTGPFRKLKAPVFLAEGEDFPAEDPYIWYQNETYYAIVKDIKGHFTNSGRSLALFESVDGEDWAPSAHTLVADLNVLWEGGEIQKVQRLERPQLLFKDGKPIALYVAVAPVDAFEGTLNIHIPLSEQ